FALGFSNGITKPVHSLSNSVREVREGDIEGQPLSNQSCDVLTFLTVTFNNLRTNIHILVVQIKEQSELDQLFQDMKIKHLHKQINRKFLFNTLNTLSKMAYLEDAKTTSSLIESVATLLRHKVGEIDKSVTLRDEVEVVKGYFHIQKTRFSE